MRNTVQSIVIGVLLALLGLLAWDWQKQRRAVVVYGLVNDSLRTAFAVRIAVDSTVIAEQQQILLTEREAKAHALLQVDDMKKIIAQLSFTDKPILNPGTVPWSPPATNWEYDTLYPLQADVIRVDSNSIYIDDGGRPELYKRFDPMDRTISVPKYFERKTPLWAVSGMVDEQGIHFNPIEITRSYRITIGDKKMGFLKRSEPIVRLEAQSLDPALSGSFTSMQNIVVQHTQPFYRKPLFWTVVGAGIMYGVQQSFK